MSRPLRIEYPGALYEITVRGNADNAIFLDDEDRNSFLKNLGLVCLKFNWDCHSYCLLDSEYQLLIETAEPNLSRGMREVNGIYTQSINRKYNKRGHVLEGRYKAIVCEKETYLAFLNRKIALLPVHRNLVYSPEDWEWSHYKAFMGKSWTPKWLSRKTFLSSFSGEMGKARREYEKFIAEEKYQFRSFKPQGQIALGSKKFVEMIQLKSGNKGNLQSLTRKQKQFKSLAGYLEQEVKRNLAIKAAFASGGYTLKEIGEFFNLHYTTVSRIAND